MQLDTNEVQVAITEYLRKRGAIIDNEQQVQLAVLDRQGQRIEIVGCTPVVVVYNAKLSEGPYR